MRFPRLSLGLLFLGLGCTVATRSFDESAKTKVPASPTPEPLVGDLGFDTLVDVDLTEAEALDDYTVGNGDVRNVRLSDLVLTATKPPAGDLSFLDRLDLYASAPGLPEVLVASMDDFPVGVSEVTFDLEDVDLTDYVLSQALTITTEASGQTPDKTTTLKVDFSVDVGVTARGACRNL